MIVLEISSSIQAGAAVFGALLTLLTLIVLLRYADDTKRIADVSASQTEHSQMPFLAVAMRENTREERGGWIVQNQGSGPALNILYSVYDGQGSKSMVPMPPLGKGATRENLHEAISSAIGHGYFEMRYESLSGLKYRTTIETLDGMQQTIFHKPPAIATGTTIADSIKGFGSFLKFWK